MDTVEFKTINPANGKTLSTYRYLRKQEIDKKIRVSKKARPDWSKASIHYRISAVESLIPLLESKKEHFAKMMAEEMGKLLTEGISEIEKCILLCRYTVENAAEILADKIISTEYTKSYVSLQPLGTILGIMPWNYPFWQVIRCAVPVLVSGNSFILKHAPNVSACAMALEELFQASGFPEGVFQTVIADVPDVEEIIRHPDIRGVSITGSVGAGRAVAAIAGSELKKCVLELGGNDAAIVLEDADMDVVLENCTQSRLLNAGQSCIAAKRFIVLENRVEEFRDGLLNLLEGITIGNPLDPNTTLGPIAREDLRNQLHQKVTQSVTQGASLFAGGYLPECEGFFYPPTVLAGVKPDMAAFREELFGPVFSIISAKNEAEAVELANTSGYGLGGSIYSQNYTHAEYIARNQLHAGSCFVNGFVKSDPRLPFGGIKNSGFGRELGEHGFKEFTNIKTVVVK